MQCPLGVLCLPAKRGHHQVTPLKASCVFRATVISSSDSLSSLNPAVELLYLSMRIHLPARWEISS